MKFTKMHGLGNDFVVLEGPHPIDAADVAALCDRRRGVGADGVLVVTPGDGRVRMDYFNADGSPAEMCGNGLRCVTRFAVDRGWAPASGFEVDTAVGPLRVAMLDERTARVEVGSAAAGGESEFEGLRFRSVSVGNPHAVTFVEDTETAPVARIGPALEQATPGGVNVEFVRAGEVLEVRTWERGCGETLACGTGAVAAAAAARAAGLSGDEARVRLLGGDLLVELDGSRAWITGPADYSFVGEFSEDLVGTGSTTGEPLID